jgi:hypothetical protein
MGSSLYSGATIDDGGDCAAGAVAESLLGAGAADWAQATAQTKSPTSAIFRKTHISHELYLKIPADWPSLPFVKSDRNFSFSLPLSLM